MHTLNHLDATSNQVHLALNEMAEQESPYFVFQRRNTGNDIVVNVQILPIPNKIKFYTNSYGTVLIDCQTQTVTGYLYDIELNRILLMGAKLFAMNKWRFKYEWLDFITKNVLTMYDTLSHVHTSTLRTIQREAQRYTLDGELIQVAYIDCNYVISLSSFAHYRMHGFLEIAKISGNAHDIHIIAQHTEHVKFAMMFVSAILDRGHLL